MDNPTILYVPRRNYSVADRCLELFMSAVCIGVWAAVFVGFALVVRAAV